jgi:hypothetical protein
MGARVQKKLSPDPLKLPGGATRFIVKGEPTRLARGRPVHPHYGRTAMQTNIDPALNFFITSYVVLIGVALLVINFVAPLSGFVIAAFYILALMGAGWGVLKGENLQVRQASGAFGGLVLLLAALVLFG